MTVHVQRFFKMDTNRSFPRCQKCSGSWSRGWRSPCCGQPTWLSSKCRASSKNSKMHRTSGGTAFSVSLLGLCRSSLPKYFADNLFFEIMARPVRGATMIERRQINDPLLWLSLRLVATAGCGGRRSAIAQRLKAALPDTASLIHPPPQYLHLADSTFPHQQRRF